jgi:hypothetical protein
MKDGGKPQVKLTLNITKRIIIYIVVRSSQLTDLSGNPVDDGKITLVINKITDEVHTKPNNTDSLFLDWTTGTYINGDDCPLGTYPDTSISIFECKPCIAGCTCNANYPKECEACLPGHIPDYLHNHYRSCA